MLETLKMLLGFNDVDEARDKKLEWILQSTSERLKLLLNGAEPPEEMSHIIIEVAVKRFNRIGSEGMKSHDVEGETIQFNSSDFDEFKDEIQAYLDSLEDSKRKGRVRFL